MATTTTTATPIVELWLTVDDDGTQLALSIPISKCWQLAVRPLKWIRFLGFAIYGSEGYLSTSDAGPPIPDYNYRILAPRYYFISNQEPRLVDPAALDDRTSNTSHLTVRRADFRQRMVDRDATCAKTNEPAWLCDALHIIPHSKGDNYIVSLLRHRGAVDDIDGIDDTKNGLLLSIALHRTFGAGAIAFLKTPNSCLSVDDIPLHPQKDQASPTNRLTLQFIDDSRFVGSSLPVDAPNNSDLREPTDTTNWPPAVLTDMAYASAVLKAWGSKPFLDTLLAIGKPILFKDLDESNNEPDDTTPCIFPDPGARTPMADARAQHLHTRNLMKAMPSHQEETTRDSMMDGVLGLWTRSTRQDKGKQEREAALELARTCHKVKAWIDSGPELDFSSSTARNDSGSEQ